MNLNKIKNPEKNQDFFVFRRNHFTLFASISWIDYKFSMKKYAFLIAVFTASFTSCTIDDGNENDFYTEVRPIESVEVPVQFIQGETYEIFVTYIKPNPCYVFNNILFIIEDHERTVTVVNTVYPNGNCAGQPEEETVSFNLTVSGSETYLFKFYQGKDEEGLDQYHLVEVPVVSGRYNLENSARN